MTVRNELCAEVWLSYPDQPHPMWKEVKTVNPVSAAALPKKYKAYEVNVDSLSAFFRTAKHRSCAVVIPVADGCEPFMMRVSDAMSPELRGKYPDLVSLQGNGVNNKAADLRLDWDGRQLQGQLTFNGSTYLIAPVAVQNGIVYLIYDRNDTNEIKQPFEARPANRTPGVETQKIQYDR